MGCFFSKNIVDETAQAPRPVPVTQTFQLSKSDPIRAKVKAPRSPPPSLGSRNPAPRRLRLPPEQIKQWQDARLKLSQYPANMRDAEDPGINNLVAVYFPKKRDPKDPAKVCTFADYIEDPKAYRIAWVRRLDD
ncbi:hypothetical protein LTS17_000876 [Exophiala oligosperma]